jgi:hypothetical protein
LVIVAAAAWQAAVIAHTVSWLIENLKRFIFWVSGYPKPKITHPVTGDPVRTPMTISGTHDKQPGNYWLVTNYRNDYWPKCKLHFRPNGRWDADISTNEDVTATILLVKVSDVQDKLFELWMQNARAHNWEPLKLSYKIKKKDLAIVDSIDVPVAKS